MPEHLAFTPHQALGGHMHTLKWLCMLRRTEAAARSNTSLLQQQDHHKPVITCQCRAPVIMGSTLGPVLLTGSAMQG